MNAIKQLSRAVALAAVAAGLQLPALAQPDAAALKPVPAVPVRHAAKAMMLGAAWAGPRAVAVGDHGVVLLSDDQGKTFRQAQAVPLSATLTSVSFVNDKTGWAVGHWGAVLRTDDGGEHWALQRLATEEDRPLFAVHFFNAQHGVAVGLWSLVLVTDDGGKTWTAQTLPPPPGANKADLNLLSLFTDARGRLYAPAERGMVLVSEDRGRSWRYLGTGYAGSFWAGTALPDGTLVVGGLRGSIYRSGDGGQHWEVVDSGGGKSSITGFVAHSAGLLAFGLDGAQLLSKDGGRSFATLPQSADRVSLTAALARPAGVPVLFSKVGVLPVSAH
jgi:photosystem II stability/assembly factor-like uncharacterized protein